MKGRATYTSLTLNQKVEMIKRSEEGMLKAGVGWKLGLLHQTAKLWMWRKKYVMEIKNATLMTRRMRKKWNSLVADTEKVLIVYIEAQTNQSILFSQSVIHSKAERDEEAAEESCRGWSMKVKERSCLHNFCVRWSSRCWCRSCSKLSRRSKIINEGGYTK